MADRVLVIAAHPDDEIPGCGDTGALYGKGGDRMTAVIAWAGVPLRPGTSARATSAAARSSGVCSRHLHRRRARGRGCRIARLGQHAGLRRLKGLARSACLPWTDSTCGREPANGGGRTGQGPT